MMIFKAKIGVTYQIVTEESGAQGDFEETGWREETTNYESGELRRIKNRYGSFYTSSASDWIDSYPDKDIETGAETTYGVHLSNISEFSKQRLHRYLAN